MTTTDQLINPYGGQLVNLAPPSNHIEGVTMQIQFEQLLNLPDIQVLNVEITEHEIKCDIESTRGYSICHRSGQKATKFFEHAETLTLRHLPICEKDVYL